MTPEPDYDCAGEAVSIIELATDSSTFRATLENDVMEDEAAAIAAAVAAHLNEESAPQDATPSLACLWTVAGRLEPATGRRPQRRQDLPGECPNGEEWAFAGRCR